MERATDGPRPSRKRPSEFTNAFPHARAIPAEMAPRRLYTADGVLPPQELAKKLAALLLLEHGWRGKGRDGEGAAQAVCAAAHCSCGSAGNADAGNQKGGGDDLDSKSLDRNFHGANLSSFRLTITARSCVGAMAKRPGICIKFKVSKPPSGFGCCRSCL